MDLQNKNISCRCQYFLTEPFQISYMFSLLMPWAGFGEPQGIYGLSITTFSHALRKSRVLLTSSFDWKRAGDDTHLWKFDLPLWSLKGCSPLDRIFAIVETVMPSLAITNSIELCIALNLRSKALTSALTSSIPASLVQLRCGYTPNPHSYWASLIPPRHIGTHWPPTFRLGGVLVPDKLNLNLVFTWVSFQFGCLQEQ